MRIGILLNTSKIPGKGLTTHALAKEFVDAGHDVWTTSPAAVRYGPDDRIRARARRLKGEGRETIALDDLDVLLLRNNPPAQSSWAQGAGIDLGRMAARRGVLVLNDPEGLSKASNKLYLLRFPEEIRPRTLVARDKRAIARFLEEEGRIVLKPLLGYGGTGVFVAHAGNPTNLHQIIEAVSRDGYVMAQTYLPAAEEGDLRLFLVDGAPLRHRGRYAAVRRRRSGDDLRSNVHAGGKPERAEVGDAVLALAAAVGPRLAAAGMFFVGLDIVGDKLMEVNVFSPGGLVDASRFEKVNFARAVRLALEEKVQSRAGSQAGA